MTKTVRLATGMAFAFRPECCSESHRNGVRPQTGIAFTFDRNPQATGETTDILGKAPQGYIIYGRDGRMMVLFVADGRPKPSDLATMTDQERADLFRTMIAYSGTYEFDGKTVTHHVDVSWNQIWTGTHQKRNVELDGRSLVITTNPTPHPMDGKVSVTVLTWKKVD